MFQQCDEMGPFQQTLLIEIWNGAENTVVILNELDIELPCDPAILLLGAHPQELKMYAHDQIYTWCS